MLTEQSHEVMKRMAIVSEAMPEIPKSKKGYNYMYTPLDKIEEVLKPLMKKHKLYKTHTTIVKDGKNILMTIIGCTDDEKGIFTGSLVIDDQAKLAKMNTVQTLGAQLTYFRRYHTAMMFNVISEEDNDASAENSNDKTMVKKGEADYISIFTNLVSKNTVSEKIQRHFNNYKDKMDAATKIAVQNIIKTKYSDIPF